MDISIKLVLEILSDHSFFYITINWFICKKSIVITLHTSVQQ